MSWQDMLDPEKGFIKDDSITLEVCLSFLNEQINKTNFNIDVFYYKFVINLLLFIFYRYQSLLMLLMEYLGTPKSIQVM